MRTTSAVAQAVRSDNESCRHADLILTMDDGRIGERGTHDSLIASGGEYAAMARQMQSTAAGTESVL